MNDVGCISMECGLSSNFQLTSFPSIGGSSLGTPVCSECDGVIVV